jgi:hypothetical protein
VRAIRCSRKTGAIEIGTASDREGEPEDTIKGGDGAKVIVRTDRAMDALRRVIGSEYRDVNTFWHESVLDPLRDRADFRVLMMDVAMPDEVFPR